MTYPELSGRVALVSGAASGIGAAVAESLRHEGMRVASCDIAESIADKTDGFRLDVSDAEAVEAVVSEVESRFGPIEVLANVAGILHAGDLLQTHEKDFNAMLAVNTSGVFHLTRAVTTRMIPRGRGSVITVASNSAGVPRQGIGAYAASKAASAHLTRCFGLELARKGIRCNVVAPGTTDTEMLRQIYDHDGLRKAIDGEPDTFRLGIPTGRIAQPADIAATVCFLSSDAATHLTMQELYVDGGAALR